LGSLATSATGDFAGICDGKGERLAARTIELRGVEVHNLKQVDLDIPHGELVVFCGVSGSGKTSMALDTLYAEGQRRYIESFSAYTRQFLERLEKPAAESIDGIPPAIAVTRGGASRSSRSTIGTATETLDYLRLLFARIGQLYCPGCGREIRRQTADTVAREIAALAAGARYMIAFCRILAAGENALSALGELKEEGFARVVVAGRTVNLSEVDVPADAGSIRHERAGEPLHVIVDRLSAGSTTPERLRDSLETAFQYGEGTCYVLVEMVDPAGGGGAADEEAGTGGKPALRGEVIEIDGRRWTRRGYSTSLACADCGRAFPEPEPRLFSSSSPLGACPTCEGFGNVIEMDMELIVPDPGKSLREGAIAPWNTPAYEHELQELLALADDYGIPVDVPFRELSAEHLRLIREGVPERKFGGLAGFFHWLERRKYKMHLRVYLSRWRSARPCPDCRGDRLRPEALCWRIGGRNIAELTRMKIAESGEFFATLALSDYERRVGRTMLEQATARLAFLAAVGLDYLTLDRTLRTLSGGEAQRVSLTTTLGSNLVNMLYVLDEPSVGLHPKDVDRLLGAVRRLRDRGNTVVVVEHEEALLRAADRLVEFGPGAGDGGGEIVFEGTIDEMLVDENSLTGDYLAARRGLASLGKRRSADRGRLRLTGARGNNLKHITVEFPLGVLCLVTGVSGAGKSTLVQDTLYGALCRRLRKDGPKPLPHDDVYGDGQIDDVLLVDQSPIGRSPRSVPVTYVKAFDEIRNVFAETLEARTRNYTAGHFSFNAEGGRCEKCGGDGYLAIDMQFLADVYMKCDECGGRRYRPEILAVNYRGRNIAEVLEMTVRQAFGFFRGQTKVQARLKRLIDVGLDYLQLGQGANTLSSGEAQRLKLAAHLATAKRNRTLLLLDEPTTGLHFSDIVKLLDCFDALLAVGHSLIVVEHNLQLMKSADYLIDLGPGAAEEGGRVIAQGTPEEVAACRDSATGRFLAAALAAEQLAHAGPSAEAR
jgi:excinuclease ABC subunit A